jgi:DNA-binding IclR family transcriptional regulator
LGCFGYSVARRMSLRDIAAEIGISKSAVHRLMRKMREDAARDSSRGGAGTA